LNDRSNSRLGQTLILCSHTLRLDDGVSAARRLAAALDGAAASRGENSSSSASNPADLLSFYPLALLPTALRCLVIQSYVLRVCVCVCSSVFRGVIQSRIFDLARGQVHVHARDLRKLSNTSIASSWRDGHGY